ncbi:MAG TPA: hypothetical protein VIM08_06125 [Arthrobacter sp.]
MSFRAGLRPLIIAVFAALAWLIWGAAAAQAAVPAPDTGLADPLTAAATPVVGGAPDPATGLPAALPPLPLVQTPLQLPPPDVLPLPGPLPGLVQVPAPVSVTVPLPEPLPGLLPLPTPALGLVSIAAPSGPAAAAAPGGEVTDLPAVSEPTQVAPVTVAAGTPGDLDAGAAAPAGKFGFVPAQDLPGAGARPAAVPGPPAPSSPPATPDLLKISAGLTGNGGPVSPGGLGAADIAGSWPALPATTGSINRPAAEAPPASPAFDPGSSPD